MRVGTPGRWDDDPVVYSSAGLFVLWEKVRHEQSRILSDLAERFDVLSVTHVEWTPALVERNFERFYCDLPVRGVYHVLNKGAGPFLAVRLRDPAPTFEIRTTSRGPRVVNANLVDAKLRYREWCAGLGVHCGETPRETQRDLAMLLGESHAVAPLSGTTWDGRIEHLDKDVAGSTGWPSEDEMFRVLDAAVDYVVLPATCAPARRRSIADGMQLLCDDYLSMHKVLGARADVGAAPETGGGFTVLVGGSRLRVGLRFAGDRFLDPRWARACLDSRVRTERRCYELDASNDAAVRLYRTLFHRSRLTGHDIDVLADASRLLQPGLDLTDLDAAAVVSAATSLLDNFMAGSGYAAVEPMDSLVPFVRERRGTPTTSVDASLKFVRRRWFAARRQAGGWARLAYLRAHDGLIRRVPSIRAYKPHGRSSGS
jgi:hypothetical protein